MSPNEYSRFESAVQAPRCGVVTEVWSFLRHNKKWWLAPILAAMALLGVLLVAGSSAAAPFVYTLF